MPIKAILTDIEGTTSAVSFVFDVLFPYAARHLPQFILEHAEEPAVAAQLDAHRVCWGPYRRVGELMASDPRASLAQRVAGVGAAPAAADRPRIGAAGPAGRLVGRQRGAGRR